MKRMLWAGLLALPLILVSTSTATAQGCASGGCPPGFGFGGGAARSNPYGCGALCFKLFGALHQDGPLFNYGPYSGYYPFAPYGPWTSDLRYTGGHSACSHCGLLGRGCGPRGCATFGGLGGLFHRDRGCNTCGGSGLGTLRSVFARLHPFQRCASAGCSSASGCEQPAAGCGGCVSER